LKQKSGGEQKTSKKSAALFIIVAMVSSFVAACGPTPAPTEAPAAPAGEPVLLGLLTPFKVNIGERVLSVPQSSQAGSSTQATQNDSGGLSMVIISRVDDLLRFHAV
jgi:hypothetical protein